MAVIKCSNCENEILDTEIVCPYCDCPISETIKKMKKDDLETYSVRSIDGLTGKFPPITGTEEPKLATSSDFEKEKAAILKDLGIDPYKISEKEEKTAEEAPASKPDITMDKTVKISREDIASGEVKKADGTTAVQEKITSKVARTTASRSSVRKKSKNNSKYVVFGITVVVIVLIVYIIWNIVGSITEKLEGKKVVNKTAEVTSSAVEVEKNMGYSFHSETLTITDDKVMKDYASSIETPWYDHINEIKYVTIGNEVTRIGAHSFEGFGNIVDLTLSGNVETIGEYAFKGCDSLEKVKIPDSNSLDKIGQSAFAGCKNLKVISGYTKLAGFEPTISEIGARAFADCSSLTEFTLPMYTQIGEDAFDGHGDDFVIICESSGDVYEYAKEYDIPTKLVSQPEANEDEPETEEPANNEPAANEPQPNEPKKEEPAPNNNTGGTEQPGNTASTQPSLGDLLDQLNKATTQEEKDRILAEIDKIG